MFTGITKQKGMIVSLQRDVIGISAPHVPVSLQKGDSVAVDGICLTLVSVTGDFFVVEVMSETIKKTTIGYFKEGRSVNLEWPATPTSFLSGHIVTGHIDGIGTVRGIGEKENSRIVSIEVPGLLEQYFVIKGSVTVNGVSLTIIDCSDRTFSVGIIPHTLRETTFQELLAGDAVNVEVDIIAKYLARLVHI